MEEKAFLKLLEENLKAEGLPVLENLAEKVYGAFSKTATMYAESHSNALVKALVPAAVKALDGVAIPAIDKIDGQPG